MNEVAEKLQELLGEIKRAAEKETWAIRRMELELAADHIGTAVALTIETKEDDAA